MISKAITDGANYLIRSGFLHFLSSNFFVKIAGFGSQFFLAWILVPSQLGDVKLMQSYLEVLVALASLGFTTSTLKLCSKSDLSLSDARNYFDSAFKMTILGAIFFYLLFTIAYYITGQRNSELIIIYLLILLPISLNAVVTVYLQSKKLFKQISKIQVSTKLFSILLIIVMTYFIGLTGFVLASIISFTLTFLVFFSFLKKQLKTKLSYHVNYDFLTVVKTHWETGKYAFLTNSINLLGAYLGLFVMDYLITDKSSIGQYAFALTMMLAYDLFTQTSLQFVAPTFTEKFSDKTNWIQTVNKSQRIYIGFSFLIAVLGISFSPFVFGYLFGGKFEDATFPFILLVISWVLSSCYKLLGVAFMSAGVIKYNFYSSSISLVISFPILFVLVSDFGSNGAAMGRIVSSVIGLFLTLFWFIRFKKGIRKVS